MKSSIDTHLIDSIEEQEVKEHITLLIEETNEQLQEKLRMQQEKKARIDALEKVFVEWADKKDNAIREKLDKYSKNKDQYLSKIVKKCQDHEKYLEEKLKNRASKRKAELKAAWKQANEFQQSIENYNISKHISKDLSKDKAANRQLKDSQLTPHPHTLNRTQLAPHQATQQHYESQPRHTLNISKENLRQSKPQLLHFLTEGDDRQQQNEQKIKLPVDVRLKETFARFRQNIETEEKGRIQLLGERLERIEKFRMKKFEQYKRKKEKFDVLDDSKVERRENKQKNKGERVHSESTMHEKRVRDWSEVNRQKREESLQIQLQTGTQYLQSRKIKFMKTHLAKKVALSAIEKKLYMERLSH